MGNERVSLEVHLRDQPLRKARSKDGIMDVGWPPAIDPIAERVGTRFDGTEEIVAAVVRQHPTAAAEVRVDRSNIGVITMAVASARIGLPYLDQGIADRLSVAVEDMTMNDDLFTDRVTGLGVVKNEVVIKRPELVRREHWARHFREGVLERPERDAW